jgi:hypothetical protein
VLTGSTKIISEAAPDWKLAVLSNTR